MKVINKEIEMIAQHFPDGKIKPVRFRIFENDESKVIPISDVLRVEEIKIEKQVVRKFYCVIVIENRRQMCEIIFKIADTKWILYRI